MFQFLEVLNLVKLHGFKEFKRETANKRPVKDIIKDSKELFIRFSVEKLRQQGAWNVVFLFVTGVAL